MAKAKRPPQTKKKLGGPRTHEGGPRQSKADAVADLAGRLTTANAVLLTEYRGMTVGELAELRASLRDAGTEYKVYKNTLATIAARNAGLEDLVQHFEGPTAFAFAEGDPVTAAKRLSEFAKKVPTLILKGGMLDRRVLTARDVATLASLESRDVMLARLAGMFQSPIQHLVNLFAAPLNQFGSVLVQLRDKMPPEGSGQPSPEPEPTGPEPAVATDASAEAPSDPSTEETPET